MRIRFTNRSNFLRWASKVKGKSCYRFIRWGDSIRCFCFTETEGKNLVKWVYWPSNCPHIQRGLSFGDHFIWGYQLKPRIKIQKPHFNWQWTDAFLVFSAIYLEKYPNDAPCVWKNRSESRRNQRTRCCWLCLWGIMLKMVLDKSNWIFSCKQRTILNSIMSIYSMHRQHATWFSLDWINTKTVCYKEMILVIFLI